MMLKDLTGSVVNFDHCVYFLMVETKAMPFDWGDVEKKSFAKRKALFVSAPFSEVRSMISVCDVSALRPVNGDMRRSVVSYRIVSTRLRRLT